MSDHFVDFSPRAVLGTVVRHWLLVGACLALGLILASARLLISGPSYSSQSQILIGQPLTLQSLTSPTGGAIDQDRLVDLTSTVLKSDTMAHRVANKLAIDEDDYSVDIRSATTTNVMGITATAGDADKARDVANTYAQMYVEDVTRTNKSKVERARTQLRDDIAKVTKQIALLEKQQKASGLAALASAPQRSALLQQRLQLQGALSQVDLAGVVDPAGGAQIIQAAPDGETSLFGTVANIVLGGLFGLLVGIGLAGLVEGRARRTTSTAASDARVKSSDQLTA